MLLEAALNFVGDESTALWVVPLTCHSMVPWLQQGVLVAQGPVKDSAGGEALDARTLKLMHVLLCALCPVNVVQIVKMAQTMEAQRKIEESHRRARMQYAHDSSFEQIDTSWPDEGAPDHDASLGMSNATHPPRIDPNEEFLRILMAELDEAPLDVT